MPDRFAVLDDADRALLRPGAQPHVVSPMLATASDAAFSDPAWLFERKLDGQRVLAYRRGDRVRLLSRNARRLEGTYPELVDALAAQPVDDFVVDGEVVAFDGGRTSFGRLQQRLGVTDPRRARARGVQVFYYLFDVVHLDGHDTTSLGLRRRKALLRRAVAFADPLRCTAHRVGAGEQYLAEACGRGWEGIVAKRADAAYVAGRSRLWLKLKCSLAQEFVVGGFTDASGSRTGFGALLVGYYDDDDRLLFAGKVGTGYSEAVLRDLRSVLDRLEQPDSPFDDVGTLVGRESRATHWVRPELVAQVGFTEWTADGRLRHPRFDGIRLDKAATEVVRERPPGRRRAER